MDNITSSLAHISEDGSRVQPLEDHLQGTAILAQRFAEKFHAGELGYYLGKNHDLGKDTPGFEMRLHGGPPVDHSTSGAQLAFQQGSLPAAFAIAGHHCGIPDGGNSHDSADQSTLYGRLKRTLEQPFGRISPPRYAPPCPKWGMNDPVTLAFFTRMVYSCLVDADFIDTETFMNGTSAPRGESESIPALLDKMHTQAQRYLSSKSVSPVSQKRNEVLRACMEHGQHWDQGLYTLTVPTGGGKTFASLAFALEHAAAHKLDRVIYVIPYTSIIDQTSQIFSELLGKQNVLAHFSSADYKLTDRDDLTPAQYRQLLASENWDAPVIVTTSVQFFESLYANRSSRCRKLHALANSVIIFDEAQTLPNDYLLPCLSAIAQLVQHYHTTAVLCTATQPALEPLFRALAPDLTMREISPSPEQLYEVLRRVTLKDLGTLTLESLRTQLAQHDQVLCVVNRRKTAQQLFALLPNEGSYCLTTLLCAADRCRQLNEIRQRLRDGLPCRVVSTSLIEAGVDVDFPAAYRERIGLDSFLQTAGRCNREGRRTAQESIVSLFELEGCPAPQMLHANIHALNTTLRHFSHLDTPPAIHRYCQELYALRDELDRKKVLPAFQKGLNGCVFPFATVAENFHLIETPTRTIYLPIDEGAALCKQLQDGVFRQSTLRRLGVYSVECYTKQFNALHDAGALELLENGDAILTDLSYYSHETGLSLDVENGIGILI